MAPKANVFLNWFRLKQGFENAHVYFMFNSSLKEECGLKDIPADFRDTNVTKVIRVLYSDEVFRQRSRYYEYL